MRRRSSPRGGVAAPPGAARHPAGQAQPLEVGNRPLREVRKRSAAPPRRGRRARRSTRRCSEDPARKATPGVLSRGGSAGWPSHSGSNAFRAFPLKQSTHVSSPWASENDSRNGYEQSRPPLVTRSNPHVPSKAHACRLRRQACHPDLGVLPLLPIAIRATRKTGTSAITTPKKRKRPWKPRPLWGVIWTVLEFPIPAGRSQPF